MGMGIEDFKVKDKSSNHTGQYVSDKPDYVDISEEEWRSLSSYQRWYHKNKEDVKNKNKDRRNEIREWWKEFKQDNLECDECEEDHHRALDLHHKDEDSKNMSVSQMVNRGHSKDKIMKEVSKCRVLCANCHRKLHMQE